MQCLLHPRSVLVNQTLSARTVGLLGGALAGLALALTGIKLFSRPIHSYRLYGDKKGFKNILRAQKKVVKVFLFFPKERKMLLVVPSKEIVIKPELSNPPHCIIGVFCILFFL